MAVRGSIPIWLDEKKDRQHDGYFYWLLTKSDFDQKIAN